MAEITRLATLHRSVTPSRRFCEASLINRRNFAGAGFNSACVLLGLLLASPVQALTFTFGDIEITPAPSLRGTSSHGYFEYVFHVVNTSEQKSHVVTLSIPFERSFAPGDSIRELRRTVQVGAKESLFVSLLQPDHPPVAGSDVAVTIDGRRYDHEVQLKVNESLRRPFSPYGGRYPSRSSPAEPLILLGPRVKPLPTRDPLPSEVMMGGPGMGGAGGPGGRAVKTPAALPPRAPAATPPPPQEVLEELFLPLMGCHGPASLGAVARLTLAWQMGEFATPLGGFAAPPAKSGLPPHGLQFVIAENWSTNWLAYTRYDGILVSAAELNEMPAGVRTALWQYVEAGGALLVLGPTDLRGLSAAMETTKDKAGWLSVWAGFGVCRVSPNANYDVWDADHFRALMEDWRDPMNAWAARERGSGAANREFPIIDDLGVPIKGLFVLMFLFTLGIGPVNMMLLSRLKRRIWLLWTTPAISLCTCVAVFGFMLISEGWEGRLRSETLTLLDETTHRATTIGWTGVYSPLTPSDGLHFSLETEVIPQRYFEGRDSGTHSCSIDLTQDQHFAAGWVEARVPTHFKVRKSELRRERVALQREQDGRWSMVNGLGVPILRFWYADAKGQIYLAEDVAAGAKATLTRTEKESVVRVHPMHGILSGNSSNWMSAMELIARNPPNYIGPGLYLAEVEGSPFLEDALPNARTRRLHALVLGFGKQGE